MGDPLIEGMVVENRGALFEVLVDGRIVRCLLRGKFKKGKQRKVAPVAAGDRVRVAMLEPGRGVIEQVLPRDSGLSRMAAGSVPLQHTLVANVEQAVIVFAAAEPRADLFMLDRFLVAATAGRLERVICINKCDLASPVERSEGGTRPEMPDEGEDNDDRSRTALRSSEEDNDDRSRTALRSSEEDNDDRSRTALRSSEVDGGPLRARFAVYRQCCERLLFTSAVSGDGVEELREALKDRRSVICGPSGVGKSSLVNAVAPGLALRTGEVGEVTHKGRHITSSISLLELPFGGWVADTPGLRQLGFWEVSPTQVADAFPDLQSYLGRCRFSNCSHGEEPGCVLRAAAKAGKVDARRLRSFLQMGGR